MKDEEKTVVIPQEVSPASRRGDHDDSLHSSDPADPADGAHPASAVGTRLRAPNA